MTSWILVNSFFSACLTNSLPTHRSLLTQIQLRNMIASRQLPYWNSTTFLRSGSVFLRNLQEKAKQCNISEYDIVCLMNLHLVWCTHAILTTVEQRWGSKDTYKGIGGGRWSLYSRNSRWNRQVPIIKLLQLCFSSSKRIKSRLSKPPIFPCHNRVCLFPIFARKVSQHSKLPHQTNWDIGPNSHAQCYNNNEDLQ